MATEDHPQRQRSLIYTRRSRSRDREESERHPRVELEFYFIFLYDCPVEESYDDGSKEYKKCRKSESEECPADDESDDIREVLDDLHWT